MLWSGCLQADSVQEQGVEVATERASYAAGRNRRSLVPLAGLAAVAVVVTALIGMFGLHYAHKGHLADLSRTGQLIVQLDLTRQAQAGFKTQVQEWKNVLLRGHDGKDHDAYLAAFVATEHKVAEALASLETTVADNDRKARIGALITAHRQLGERYRAVLAGFTVGVTETTFAIDRAIRGADRPVSEDIDSLAEAVMAQITAETAVIERRAAERYAAMYRAAMTGLVVCVLLMGGFLYAAIRSDSQR